MRLLAQNYVAQHFAHEAGAVQDSFPGTRKRERRFWHFRTGVLAGRRRLSGQRGIHPSHGLAVRVHCRGNLRRLLRLGLANESLHIQFRPVETFAHLF